MDRKLQLLPKVAALWLALAGCGAQDLPQPTSGFRSRIGYGCTVQFRRDALGAAATNAIPPTTNSMNGAEVSFGGKLINVTGDWLVIERLTGAPNQTVETWVPFHSVLLLEWSREPMK
jgi:hypothetical protein